MDHIHPVASEKILSLTFRVEPGCLGPEGSSHIEDFCQFAQRQLSTSNNYFLLKKVIPRFDKTTPELQYQINNKTLSLNQVTKYLSLFKKDISDIEDDFQEEIAQLIEEYTTE